MLGSGGPLFFGGIACLLGGFLTERQVCLWGRAASVTILQGVAAYAIAGEFMLAAVACTPGHIALAYASLCFSSFVKDFGMAASWSTTIDVGHRHPGTVARFMNTVGNLGQVVSVPVVAWLAILAGAAEAANQSLLQRSDVFRCRDLLAICESSASHCLFGEGPESGGSELTSQWGAVEYHETSQENELLSQEESRPCSPTVLHETVSEAGRGRDCRSCCKR